ncbi:MAG: hypothetical protein RIQ51_126 [Bacteroidota bacterium]
MRITVLLYGLIGLALMGCSSPTQDPAQLGLTPKLNEIRFDSAFFAMDSLHFEADLAKLVQQYPQFSEDYFNRILMLSSKKESEKIWAFYKAYLPIYQATSKIQAYKKASPEIAAAFKRFHFYFPTYPLPKQIIYFIGPLETYGNVVTKDGLAIGLQLYMGAASSWYFSEQINTIYPTYISRHFAPEYIVVNSVQNILNDYDPLTLNGKQLIEQMIEIGKRQYILSQCLPNASDTLILGYTSNQLKAIEDNKGDIWTFLSSQNRLFSVDPSLTSAIINEAPYNDYFGEDIPGNVGKYIGYTIVKSWMKQQDKKLKNDLNQLLKTPAKTIFDQADIDF